LFIDNKISEFEADICAVLSRLAHHVHRDIISLIQSRNSEEYAYFSDLFGDKIDVDDYLFEGSACVFPGVRRSISGEGKKRAYNPEHKAIIDDNTFPRHIWCYLDNGKGYSSKNWQNPGLGEFELAHVFTHKKTEVGFEKPFFSEIQNGLAPYGEFTCACNVVMLPKGTVRPTDNSMAIKGAFYKRYVELYGEHPLNGRAGLNDEFVPEWYGDLKWNEPVLPTNWERNIERLLVYRKSRITHLMKKFEDAQ
jgi:hypothetical protein